MHYKLILKGMILFVAVWVINLTNISPFGEIEGKAIGANQLENERTPVEVEVMLRCEYLDGEISEEKIKETVYSYENFWAKYDDWQYIGMDHEKLIFYKKMDDISPLLKANGYFGVTDEGILTIFNGKPYKSHIIHSFFQIDVGKLESRKREELMRGIRIKTKDRYVEVLETFKPYTKEDMEAD